MSNLNSSISKLKTNGTPGSLSGCEEEISASDKTASGPEMANVSAVSERICVVRPDQPFWSLDWKEIWRYRYMFLYLVRRDLVVTYKQTVLGPAWLILQPLVMGFLMTIVFSRVAGLRTDGVPAFLFYFGNNVFWAFLSSSYSTASGVFKMGKSLMGKVYFPRLIIPMVGLGGNIFRLAIQILFLGLLIVWYTLKGYSPAIGMNMFLLPVVVIQIGLVGVGAGLLFAWLTLKYRDLGMIGSLFVQGWMYLSPVAYPLSEVPDRFVFWFSLNPLTSALELARYALYETPLPPVWVLATGGLTSAILFIFGLLTFNVVQRKFIDVI